MENKTSVKKLRDIAKRHKVIDRYISYLESVVQGHAFNACELANEIYKAAMTKYDMQTRREIDVSTGITIVEVYHDAV